MAKPEGIARDQDGAIIQALAFGTVIEVDYLSTSVASSGTMGGTVIRIISTTDCYVEVGTSPTATSAGSTLLPANSAEYIKCKDGDKVAAIRKAQDGTLNITVML